MTTEKSRLPPLKSHYAFVVPNRLGGLSQPYAASYGRDRHGDDVVVLTSVRDRSESAHVIPVNVFHFRVHGSEIVPVMYDDRQAILSVLLDMPLPDHGGVHMGKVQAEQVADAIIDLLGLKPKPAEDAPTEDAPDTEQDDPKPRVRTLAEAIRIMSEAYQGFAPVMLAMAPDAPEKTTEEVTTSILLALESGDTPVDTLRVAARAVLQSSVGEHPDPFTALRAMFAPFFPTDGE